jgi:hypothetical protein
MIRAAPGLGTGAVKGNMAGFLSDERSSAI